MAAAAFNASTTTQPSFKEQPESKETNIQVVVRLRPRSAKEVRENSSICVTTNGAKGKEVHVKTSPSDVNSKTYTFDKAFGPEADQDLVYHEVVAPMLEEVLMGYNCTLFAYGQTGTGKTYTMEGSLDGTVLENQHAGIIPRALNSLFNILETSCSDYSVRVSMLELYNEELNDLLGVDGLNTKLRLFEDAKGRGSVVIQGLEEVLVKNVKDVLLVLRKGAERRQTAGTLMNDKSSRSHCVFSITVHTKEATPEGEDLLKVGKLNLVDLAGSENIGRSGAENKRAREAGMINQSLLTLGRVINALVEKSQHIPYRESKLTRLLQDSLGGRTKTCIIATVSPAKINIDETLSTLDYAHRAKNIRNKPEVNQRMTKKALIREYVQEIERLKTDLLAAREKSGVFLTLDRYNELMEEQQGRKDRIDELAKAHQEREEQLKRREEMLAQVRAELTKERTRREQVEAEYERVSITLAKTEHHLEETKTALREQRALTQAHQTTEIKLDDTAKQLLKTATSGLADLEQVQSKLDRKQMVDELNDAVLGEFKENVGKRLTNLSSSASKFKDQRATDLGSLGESIEVWRASAVQEQGRNMDQLRKQADSVSEALENLILQAEGSLIQPMRSQLSGLQKSLGELSTSTAAMAQSGESGWNGLLSSWDDFSKQWKAEMDDWTGSLDEGLTKIRDAMDSHVDHLSVKLQESASELESKLQDEIAALSQRYAEVESLVASQNEEAEKQQNRALETMTSLLLEMNQLRAKSHSELNRRLNASNEAGSQAMHDLGRVFAGSSSAITQQTQAFSRELGSLVRRVEAAKTNAVDKENAQAKAWEQTMREDTAQAKSKLEAALGECKQVSSTIGNGLSSATSMVHAFAESHKAATSSARALVVRNLELSESALNASTETLKGHLDDLENWRNTAADGNDSAGQDEASQISEIAEATDNLFAKDLRKDEPTGSTPPRRKFRYPQTWERTRPHDEILAALRLSANEAAAATLPTPISPEDGEAASPISEAARSEDNDNEDDEAVAVASDISEEDIQHATDVPLPPSRSESRASERSEVPSLRPDSRLAAAAAAAEQRAERAIAAQVQAQAEQQKRAMRADTGGSKIPSMRPDAGGTKLPMAKSAPPTTRRAGATSTATVVGKDEGSQ